MRRKSLLLAVGLLLLTAASAPNHAAAQDPSWQESFDDPQMPGWEHSPEAVVVDGILQIGPGNFAARMGGWADFELSFRMRFTGTGESQVNYRASDSGGYALTVTEGELVLFKEQPPNGRTELARSSGWQPTEGEWTDIRITLRGGTHSVDAGEEAALSATDPAPLGPGTIVFASHGERTTEIDDVSLQVLASESAEQSGVPMAEPTPRPPTPTPEPTTAPNTLQTLFSELSTSQGSTVELGTFAVNLVLAVISSFILSRVYIYWGSSLSNRRKFAANFMLITATTTFIILVVRSSVALSLGLVGALSIIRFRTAVKEPEELAYLFFAISLGIGLGDNQRLITLLSLVVVILLIGLARLLRQSQADVNLHLAITSRGPAKPGMQQVQELLEKHCAKLRLIRFDENADSLEMAYVVEFRHLSDLEAARIALQELSPGMEISFLDNKGIW